MGLIGNCKPKISWTLSLGVMLLARQRGRRLPPPAPTAPSPATAPPQAAAQLTAAPAPVEKMAEGHRRSTQAR